MSKQKISYEKYGQVVEKLNIACGVCCKFEPHNKETADDLMICETCIRYNAHKAHYTSARHAYKEDEERKWPAEVEVHIIDLQKVLLLPKVTTKDSFFISRLVTFSETFASLHKRNNKCYIWHEAIRRRNAQDIASTFYRVIKNSNSNVMTFTFWIDNCSAQNKNWTLYTLFVCLVNGDWGSQNIIVKYFEPGTRL
nr:unnamed protein product [Callosobruchus analis]